MAADLLGHQLWGARWSPIIQPESTIDRLLNLGVEEQAELEALQEKTLQQLRT